jgi:hypothetical protein
MQDLNIIPSQGGRRSPRAIVKIDGVALECCESFSVNNNVLESADTASLQLVADNLPKKFASGYFLETSTKEITVQIWVGLPDDPNKYSTDDLTEIFYGRADNVEFDNNSGCLNVRCRDLTYLFIDRIVYDRALTNQTASQAAIAMAKKHGLTPVVTRTTRKIGSYAGRDHIRLSHHTSEWEFLRDLGRQEGFLVYVKGQELHFEPRLEPNEIKPFVLQVDRNEYGGRQCSAMRFNLARPMHIAKGVGVVVKSFGAKHKTITAYYPKEFRPAKPGAAEMKGQVYHFVKPGLTQKQAADLAEMKYKEIIEHTLTIGFTAIGNPALTCQTPVILRGSEPHLTPVFGKYFHPKSITTEFSVGKGYTMAVQCTSKSPYLEQQI